MVDVMRVHQAAMPLGLSAAWGFATTSIKRKNNKMRKCILSGVCGVALALPTLAAITPATLINGNMVLQRDQ